MKRAIRFTAIALTALLCLPVFSCDSTTKEKVPESTVPFKDVESSKSDKVKPEDLASRFLIFSEQSQSKFGERMSKALITGFNYAYPNLVETWCHGLYKDVVYIPDPDTGAAYATSGSHAMERKVGINYEFLTSVNEVDAVTHELTHCCQEYVDGKYGDTPSAEGGNWIVEGMTDYSRYTFGIYPNSFALPGFSGNETYTDSYRVTARFFLWVNQNILPTFTEEFNEYLRAKAYTSSMFKDLTGYTLDELWQMYADDKGKINGTSGSIVRK